LNAPHSKRGTGQLYKGESPLASLVHLSDQAHQDHMTRDEALGLYRPARAGIQRVLKTATAVCSHADWMRAAKHLGVWSEDRIVVDDESAIDMIADVALFEPNQRKRRAYDRFLNGRAQQLDPADLHLATRMAGAFFSIFKVVDRYVAAGIWVENVLDENHRIWVLDEGLESSAPVGLVFGMRLFDVGPFHAGFGIVVPADEETAYFCAQAKGRGGPLPVRNSLAATLYGDEIRAGTSVGQTEEEMLNSLLDLMAGSPPVNSNKITKPQARSKRRSRA
jgi:hypothetical protein